MKKILLFLACFVLAGCANVLDGVTRTANAVEAVSSPASQGLDVIYEAQQRACLGIATPEGQASCVAQVRSTFAEALDLRDQLALASAQLADLVKQLQAQKGQPTEAQLLTVAKAVDALIIAEGRFLATKPATGVK